MLTIVRHSYRDDGENSEKYSGTRNNNCPLSEKGKEYAAVKARELIKVLNSPLKQIYTSPFLRTRQTADVFADIHEKAYGNRPLISNLMELAEGQDNYKPNFSDELKNDLLKNGISYPESFDNIKKRCNDAIIIGTNHMALDNNVLFVTHGIICNTLIQNIFPEYKFYGIKKPEDYVPKCCDLSVFKLDLFKWSLVYSDTPEVTNISLK